VSEKFDLVRNCAVVVDELLSLPVAIISNLSLSPQLIGFSFSQKTFNNTLTPS